MHRWPRVFRPFFVILDVFRTLATPIQVVFFTGETLFLASGFKYLFEEHLQDCVMGDVWRIFVHVVSEVEEGFEWKFDTDTFTILGSTKCIDPEVCLARFGVFIVMSFPGQGLKLNPVHLVNVAYFF
jgi:hypothetical protein